MNFETENTDALRQISRCGIYEHNRSASETWNETQKYTNEQVLTDIPTEYKV